MIRAQTAALFQKLDTAGHGSSLQTQIEAAALLIFQCVVTASRASGIDRTRVLRETMSGVGQFIAVCEVHERAGDSKQNEAAADVASVLISKYTTGPK